jgi:hypothetical protein
MIYLGYNLYTKEKNFMLRKSVVRIFMLMIAFALVSVLQVQAQATNTVRAVWNQTTLVLINVSADGVDLSELSLEGSDSALTPDQWVMNVDSVTTLSYPLTNVRPGSCLVAYVSGTEPEIPSTVSCTRTIGEATLESIEDVVWDVTAGSFTPNLAGTAGEPCDLINRTSCNIDVNPANLDAQVTEEIPEEVTVRAIWNNDILVLINVSGYGADLSTLALTGTNAGIILPENWVMQVPDGSTIPFDLSNVDPGGCLVTYLSVENTTDAAPELPENVSCDNIVALFTLVNPDDQVWSLEAGGFTPSINDEAGDACDIVDTTVCDITVPNADLDTDGDTEETTGTSDAPVRAIWNNEILVLINVSSDGVDLSGLSLNAANGDGALLPENWIMSVNPDTGQTYSLTDVRPGSCLISYLSEVAGTAAPALPSTVSCTRIIGEFPLSNPVDQVWSIEAGGFSPAVDDVVGDSCDIVNRTSCDIALP